MENKEGWLHFSVGISVIGVYALPAIRWLPGYRALYEFMTDSNGTISIVHVSGGIGK